MYKLIHLFRNISLYYKFDQSLVRIIGKYLDGLGNCPGVPVKMDFYFNLTAAAGRDLLC